ncbi:MAG: hypothetical protein HWQ35_03675 [Nostoc sp. NMS1]|uniref:hypothetical protein n=1 Tax=unclassified Nostoc TaxID=2593658 RepID=UPI0025F31A86|nr:MULTISPECIES: hypothetical protein [unclassified Nostoc]MBN3905698.1 hypothetical protein [Nostoc sp. NMS1]
MTFGDYDQSDRSPGGVISQNCIAPMLNLEALSGEKPQSVYVFMEDSIAEKRILSCR